MARVPYVDPDTVPDSQRALLESLSEADDAAVDHPLTGGDLNVFRALAQDPALLGEFREYAGTLRRDGPLSSHEREYVILATAHAAESAYEWHQHVRVALDEGMSPDQIRAVSADESDAFAPEHAALVSYVRQFVAGDVDDAAHERLTTHYDDATAVAAGLLSGLYLGLARTIDALQIDLEAEFVGWNLERL